MADKKSTNKDSINEVSVSVEKLAKTISSKKRVFDDFSNILGKISEAGKQMLSDRDLKNISDSIDNLASKITPKFKTLTYKFKEITSEIEKLSNALSNLNVKNLDTKAILKPLEFKFPERVESLHIGTLTIDKFIYSKPRGQTTDPKDAAKKEQQQIENAAIAQRNAYIKKTTTDLFSALDTATEKFRVGMGMLPSQTKALEVSLRNTSTELRHMGILTEDIATTQINISKHYAGTLMQSKELVSTTAQLNKQFGISNDTTLNFLKIMGGVANKAGTSQIAMVGFAKEMANATNIPLDTLMSDIASSSDEVRIFMGDSEVSLVKAATAARMLGTSMNAIAGAAKGILEFDSSITAELKASALIGQNINFNQARRLAFNKDTIGMMNEIKKIAAEIDFSSLNPIQQEAFARAASVSVTELQNMAQQEKVLRWIREHGTAEQLKSLDYYEKLNSLHEDEARSMGNLAAKELDRIANQSRLNQLQSAWATILQRGIYPILDTAIFPILNAITWVLNSGIGKVLSLIIGSIAVIGTLVYIPLKFISLLKSLKLIFTLTLLDIRKFPSALGIFASAGVSSINAVRSALGIFASAGVSSINAVRSAVRRTRAEVKMLIRDMNQANMRMRGMGVQASLGSGIIPTSVGSGKVSKLSSKIPMGKSFLGGVQVLKFVPKFAGIGKFLFSIGKLGTAITGTGAGLYIVLNLLFNVKRIWDSFQSGLWNGIKTVGSVIIESLLGPFMFVWDWIKGIFIGNSPSKLGLGIVNGLTSVGGMIINALVSPFKIWYNTVKVFFSAIQNSTAFKFVNSMLEKFTSPFSFSKPAVSVITSANSGANIIKPIVAENEAVSQSTKDANILNKGGKNTSDDNQSIINTLIEKFDKLITINTETNNNTNLLTSALTALVELLESGNIGINLDGTKLNYALNNAKQIHGSYGHVTKM